MVGAERAEALYVAVSDLDAGRLRAHRQWPSSFSYYNKRVEVHDSARKHGVEEADINHVVDNALAIEDAGDDPDRWLVIGPDRAGNLLELVVMTTVEGNQLVIHAMPMRAKFRRLLGP